MTIGANQCNHGQLARSCDICERDERIAELEAENASLTIKAGQTAVEVLSIRGQLSEAVSIIEGRTMHHTRSRCTCHGCAFLARSAHQPAEPKAAPVRAYHSEKEVRSVLAEVDRCLTKAVPPTCQAWCGTRPQLPGEYVSIDAVGLFYCSRACRAAGRPLNPAAAPSPLRYGYWSPLLLDHDLRFGQLPHGPEECVICHSRRQIEYANRSPAAPEAVPRGHCGRCSTCGWPLGKEGGQCRPGDCSMRPMLLPRPDCAGCGAPFADPAAPVPKPEEPR